MTAVSPLQATPPPTLLHTRVNPLEASHARVLVLSNREPYKPLEGEAGISWQASIGGLTAALEPVLRTRGGAWVAWGEGAAEVEELALPLENPSYTLERIQLSEEEVAGFYHGFSNRALWPLCHYFIQNAVFRREEWESYVAVNRRFAERAVAAYQEGDLIWVQDYQLALVPRMIREALPEARIGVFWHIPWPSMEVFRILPWDREIVEGLLGADLIGFHTSDYVRHFRSSAARALGLSLPETGVTLEGRHVRTEAWPIGIEYDELARLGRSKEVRESARTLRSSVGSRIILGVDRMDYTKGIPERLEAYGDYLAAHPEIHGQVTLVQVAVPSREAVESYQSLRDQVEGLVGKINGQYGQAGWTPVQYIARGMPRDELLAYYQAAEVMLVTPLRDGLNLVAKEFVAVSRDGVLVLSEFAGAAAELEGAVLVNPFDRERTAEAIFEAMKMGLRQKSRRLEAMRRQLAQHDVHAWAEGFLGSLEREGGG